MNPVGLYAARQGGQLSSPARTGLAWVRKVPSGQLAPRGGTVVGLAVERLIYWQGGSYLFCPPVRSATHVQLC